MDPSSAAVAGAPRPAGDPRGARAFFRADRPEQTYSESSSSALLGLFFYSALMFTLPLVAFFGARHALQTRWSVEPPYDLLGAALAAVATVNAVIALYVCKAFKEVAKEERTDDGQQRQKTE